MKRILIALSLLAVHASAQENPTHKLTYFYQKPSPETFIEAQNFLLNIYNSENKKRYHALTLWAYTVSKEYGYPLQADFFPKTIALLENNNSQLAQFVADDTLVTPVKLDMWWAQFFATGDKKYVQNVLTVASEANHKPQQKQSQKPTKNISMVTMAAHWSFLSNCKQHARIRRFATTWQKQSQWNAKAQQLLTACTKQ